MPFPWKFPQLGKEKKTCLTGPTHPKFVDFYYFFQEKKKRRKEKKTKK